MDNSYSTVQRGIDFMRKRMCFEGRVAVTKFYQLRGQNLLPYTEVRKNIGQIGL